MQLCNFTLHVGITKVYRSVGEGPEAEENSLASASGGVLAGANDHVYICQTERVHNEHLNQELTQYNNAVELDDKL